MRKRLAGWAWLVVAVVPAATGCFTYVPLEPAARVQAGEHVAVEVTDRGRAELENRLGSGILRIEGTLSRADTTNLVMNVWRVASIDGGTFRWSGESVQFRRDFAARMHARVLNRKRTYILAGAVAVGLVVFTKSLDLFGSFIGGSDPPVDPEPDSYRGVPYWPH